MGKKTTSKLNETKATVKETETPAAIKIETVEIAAEEKKVMPKNETEAQKTTRKARAVKKTIKEEPKLEVFIQYEGREAIVADAIEKAKAEFVADGHRVSSIKSLQIYLKPEEYAAYYVINQKFAGKVDLF